MPDTDVTAQPGVRDLFGVEPEGFISARDAFAKRLKADGDDAAATAVKKLRRPTVAAWAVDQVARAEPGLLDELLSVGERLAGVQRQAMSGKRRSDDIRKASEERRALIRRLTDVAVAALEGAGRPGENARAEIAGTFEAVTLDAEAAKLVRAGVLERTVKPSSGLGAVEGFTVLEGGGDDTATPPARKAASAKREAERAVRAADTVQAAADAAAARAKEQRAAADGSARQARERAAAAHAAERDATRLAAEAKTARARAERAVRRLDT